MRLLIVEDDPVLSDGLSVGLRLQGFTADAVSTLADARAALQQLDPLWDELFPAEQARIVALLVERVDIGTDGLNVRLRMDGLGSLAREMRAGDMGAAA